MTLLRKAVLLGVVALIAAPLAMAQNIQINEIRIDQPSGDVDEFFELVGPPGASLDGLTYVVIGDGSGGSGVIETNGAIDLTGSVIPASGIFLVAETSPMPTSGATPDLVASLGFENGDNVTHLLVSGFTGAPGDDLDTNDDCTLDVMPWTAVIDKVALIEEDNPPTGTECHYGPATVGPDGSFVPGHVYLCASGWLIGAFDPVGGDDTPGAANNCPVPVLESTWGAIKSQYKSLED